MGCSPTKASRVTAVNSKALQTKNGDRRTAPNERIRERNRRNHKNHNIYNTKHRRITPWPKKSRQCDKLQEMADSGDDEVFLPEDRGPQTEMLDKDSTMAHQAGLNTESHERVQNGDPASKPQKNVPSPPLLYGHREISSSQLEFFRMLDEKIAMGQSLSSLGSVR